MAQLAIKGHETRGKEVIEILKMLGGNNKYHINITECNLLYTIREGDDVIIGTYPNSSISQIYTLERFLEKFPYKVGDKVICRPYIGAREICEIKWDNNCIKYGIGVGEWFTTPSLQPYKEETMENKGTFREDEGTLVEIDLTREFKKSDEIEVILGDYEFVFKNRKTYFVKKKPQYPKTYEECCQHLGCDDKLSVGKLVLFQQLINARNAYWKIAGEQMGLGKPWEPDLENEELYCIQNYNKQITISRTNTAFNKILIFPNKEMCDAFYENFKDLIEQCKELL